MFLSQLLSNKMKIELVIEKGHEYMRSLNEGQEKEQVKLLVSELEKVAAHENYRFSSSVLRSLVDSFDMGSDYWKNYFYKYWDSNPHKFEEHSDF